jgi:hypothetical protein
MIVIWKWTIWTKGPKSSSRMIVHETIRSAMLGLWARLRLKSRDCRSDSVREDCGRGKTCTAGHQVWLLPVAKTLLMKSISNQSRRWAMTVSHLSHEPDTFSTIKQQRNNGDITFTSIAPESYHFHLLSVPNRPHPITCMI